jgi:heavy metal sensor kinase
MKGISIGLRLTFWYVVIFAVAQMIFGAGMWFVLRQTLYQISDHSLLDRIDDVQRFLDSQKKDATEAKFAEELAETYLIEHSGDYLQVRTADGRTLFRSPRLHEDDFIRSGAVVSDRRFANQQLRGRPFRIVSQTLSADGQVFTVQIGQPMLEAQRTLDLFRDYLFMFAPIVFLVAAILGHRMSSSALSPVNAITSTVRSIGAHDLSSRLPKLQTADELQRLSETLNEMLSRIEGAFSHVRQFTADASHELRTPISLIRTEAEIALRRGRSGTQYQESLRHILSESIRTSALIDELLTLARADAGTELLKIQRIELGQICREHAREWRLAANDRGLEFVVYIPDEDVFVMADPQAIQRVINILLENACRYTPAPGKVELALLLEGNSALLHVRDSGIGIPEREKLRIFERFYRSDAARNREHGGAGLGLAIASWISLQHGGSIRVRDAEVKGSDFVVEIPLANQIHPLMSGRRLGTITG